MLATEWKCGLSLGGFFNKCTPDHIRHCKENGIFAVEVNHTVQDIQTVKQTARQCGVTLWSYHLPFLPFEQFDPASPDPVIRENTFSLHKTCLRQAAELGCSVAVIHPSGEPIPKEQRSLRMTAAKHYLRELAGFAESLGITVAVENLPRTCLGNGVDEMKELLCADKRLKMCLDTNHLLNGDIIQMVKTFMKDIITLHVSDYDFQNEKHWLPYEGDIDWVDLVTALEEVGYSGPFLYEVAETPLPIKNRSHPTIHRPRPLTLQDIRENFDACVNKRPATPIGTRNKEECTYSADWMNQE